MDTTEKVVFKRRKVNNLRKRRASESDSEQPPQDSTLITPSPSVPTTTAERNLPPSPDPALNREKLQELRRRRQQHKGISNSVEVSSLNRKKRAAPEPEPAPPTREDMSEAMMSNRFIKQTGLVVNDTRDHMNAFIDSKLRELRGQHAESASRKASESLQVPDQSPSASPSSHAHPDAPHKARQNALSGKIEEIDLGPQAARENMLRTAAAAHRLAGSPNPTNTPSSDADDPFPRGRRPKKTAAQLERAALVDMILGEKTAIAGHSRYDDSSAAWKSGAGAGQDGYGPDDHDDADADDVLADQFVKAWEEQAQGRQRMRAPPPPSAAKAGGPRARAEAEKAKGPKLGGSRSARAAVRAQEEAAAREKLRR